MWDRDDTRCRIQGRQGQFREAVRGHAGEENKLARWAWGAKVGRGGPGEGRRIYPYQGGPVTIPAKPTAINIAAAGGWLQNSKLPDGTQSRTNPA